MNVTFNIDGFARTLREAVDATGIVAPIERVRAARTLVKTYHVPVWVRERIFARFMANEPWGRIQ